MRVPLIESRQQQMLQELCDLHRPFHDVGQNSRYLQKSLSRLAVLLVLDDVWSQDQLESLLVAVAPGSKVIVTSRDRGLLQRFLPSLSMPFQCLEVQLLSPWDSLELLCLHVFGSPNAPSQWAERAKEAADTCSGLPVTLSVIGSFLAGQRDPQIWEDVCYRLHKAQPPDGLQNNDSIFAKLRVSYDFLEHTLQDMLLDVACALLGHIASAAVCAWGPGGKLGLENLRNLSLVTVEKGLLAMHDQIRDMLRSQVEQDMSGRLRYAWDQTAAEIMRSSTAQQVGSCLCANTPSYKSI